MLIYAEPKFTELLYLFCLFCLKHIKDMEPKSISDVTSTRSNPCSTPSGHSEGDMTYYVCSLNLLPLLMKCNTKVLEKNNCSLWVKSGIYGQTAQFGQLPYLFHISNIGIKNELTKQTVKILMRRLIRSRLIWIYTVCKCVSEVT